MKNKEYRILKVIIASIIFLFSRIFHLFKKQDTNVIIYYHGILDNQKNKFENQIDYLMKNYNVVSLDDINNSRFRGNTVSITFDDGLVSFYRNAFPIFMKKRIPVTVFVPTAYIGKRPGWKRYVNNTNDAVMDLDELNNILNNNCIIGSHGINHHELVYISDEEAEKEIIESKKILEKKLNTTINYISFPYGSFYLKHIDLAKKAGYKKALGISTHISKDKDLFLWGRINVDPLDWNIEFRLKASGYYNIFRYISVIKKKAIGLRKVNDK